MSIKLKDSEFKVRINELNQVTIISDIRNKYGVQPDDEIVLELKGKITNEVINPSELLKEKRKQDLLKQKQGGQ